MRKGMKANLKELICSLMTIKELRIKKDLFDD